MSRDAKDSLLEFLNWNDSDGEEFGQKVKIVLVSTEFTKELTTSVMWLNNLGLDIRCVRMHPYTNDGQTFLDVQTIIPIPEAADYQVRIRKQKQKERESRQSARDFTKYDVSIAGKQYRAQSKRKMMFLLVSEVLANGGTPQQVMEVIPRRKFKVFEGTLDAEQVKEQIMKDDGGGAVPRSRRFFCDEDEPFHVENKTYVLGNQWGTSTLDTAKSLAKMFPNLTNRLQADRVSTPVDRLPQQVRERKPSIVCPRIGQVLVNEFAESQTLIQLPDQNQSTIGSHP